jgi:hypothetical protein
MSVIYRILVKDGNGDTIGEFDQFKNLSFRKRLNDYGWCNFDVPVNSAKAASLLALRKNTVWIYRNDDLVWSGEQGNRIGNLNDKGDNWVTIYCFDWFEQLTSRYTGSERVFSGVDAGEIAWTLIDESQSQTNGNLGITEGTIEATQNRDKTYYNNNIADMITNLSNLINGFDFEINNLKVFNVYASMGVDRSADLVLEYGTNITNVRITEDFSKPVNRAIVLGDSGDPVDPLRVERDDAALKTEYKLREGLLNEATVSEITTLEAKGDAFIRKYGNPLIKLDLDIVRSTTPTVTDVALGDIIRLIVKTGIYNIDSKFRIFEWNVNYQEDNTENLTLVLGNFTIEE